MLKSGAVLREVDVRGNNVGELCELLLIDVFENFTEGYTPPSIPQSDVRDLRSALV